MVSAPNAASSKEVILLLSSFRGVFQLNDRRIKSLKLIFDPAEYTTGPWHTGDRHTGAGDLGVHRLRQPQHILFAAA